MKNIFKLLLISLVFASCEDAENVIFDGSAENPVFLSFESSSINFPVPRTEGGTFTLILNSSTVSSVDRTYTLAVDEELSTATDAQYDFPSQITIPAGSYQGFAEVQGYDVDLDAETKTVVFSISNLQGEFVDDAVITLNLFEVCPLGAPFTGQYIIEQVGGGLPTVSGNPLIYGPGLPVVTILPGATTYERIIADPVYPTLGGFDAEFRFLITCAGISLTNTVDLGVGCGGPTIQFGPAASPGAVNHDDDTSFQIRITENRASACSGSPRQVTLLLTKVVN